MKRQTVYGTGPEHAKPRGQRVPVQDHKAFQAEQERAAEAVSKAEDAHRRYDTVARTLRETLTSLQAAIVKIEDDEHHCRRVLGQEPSKAADYAYIRSVLVPLMDACRLARSANYDAGEPTAAKLEAAEKRSRELFEKVAPF